jgi:hypothetical protein
MCDYDNLIYRAKTNLFMCPYAKNISDGMGYIIKTHYVAKLGEWLTGKVNLA